ncbi:MAG: hypothetical protein NTW08_04675 [Gammaproteobacteria bacterium]|nr:hypothetical protein [Gammaproteobacteria bacterium]
MFSYVMKSFTVTQVLTSKILRTPFRIVGWFLDRLISLFWGVFGDQYESMKVPFTDGETGQFFSGVLGWIGEGLGFVIGTVLAIPLGITTFAIHKIVEFFLDGYRLMKEKLSSFAQFVYQKAEDIVPFDILSGDIRPLEDGSMPYSTASFWIGAGTIGMVLAIPFYLIAVFMERVFQLEEAPISEVVIMYIGLLGGCIGTLLGGFLYLPKIVLDLVCHLVDKAGVMISNLVALVYAKNEQSTSIVLKDRDQNYLGMEKNGTISYSVHERSMTVTEAQWSGENKYIVESPATHSDKFRRRVDELRHMPYEKFFTEVLFTKPIQDEAVHAVVGTVVQ